MRLVCVVAILAVSACGGLSADQSGGGHQVRYTAVPPASAQTSPAAASEGAPFSGVWESCEGAASPDECSRYVLVQRGERVCATWSYVASGQSYEGKFIARTTSETSAVATQTCGRVGSETDSECADGWQRATKALNLCSGKLSDIRRADGSCMAEYVRIATHVKADQSWLRACVAEVP